MRKIVLVLVGLLVMATSMFAAEPTKRTSETYSLGDGVVVLVEYENDIPTEFDMSELDYFTPDICSSSTFEIRPKTDFDLEYIDNLYTNWYYKQTIIWNEDGSATVHHEYVVEIDLETVISFYIIQEWYE